MKQTLKNDFIAAVKDDYLDQMDEVADRLRIKGCEIRRIMKLTGVITGRLKAGTEFSDLYVEGIASVEKQRLVRKRPH